MIAVRPGPRSSARRCGGRLLAAAVLALAVAGGAGIASASTTPAVQPVVLPADQGAHPAFSVEWWYTAGTFADARGRDYFWFATVWSGAGALLARVNVVDLRADRIVLSREYLSSTPATNGQTQFSVGTFGLGWRPGGAWGQWSVDAPGASGGGLQLTLSPRQAYVLNGHDGIIQQGPGGPSAYYSSPRLAARGTLVLNGKKVSVTGQGWLDHQWGNFGSDLAALRWNWFACQFQNGSDLMLYQFLNRDDRPSGDQNGTLVTARGAVKHVSRFAVVPLGPFIRPAGASATYPLRWRLEVPSGRIDITVRSRARHQFITNQFVPSFWEGAASITSGTPGTCIVESSREVGAPQ
jgi:predicted secreted hydrolase